MALIKVSFPKTATCIRIAPYGDRTAAQDEKSK